MIGVDKALEFILKQIVPGEAEKVPILDALDRVLAEDIYSEANVPPFDNSTIRIKQPHLNGQGQWPGRHL
jgi:molybdopterin biosynthesis enzyme